VTWPFTTVFRKGHIQQKEVPMAPAYKTLLTGTVVFVAGLALWLFGLDFEIVVFTPSKIGLVMMVVGALEALYGVFRVVREQPGRDAGAS
jgi:hypothetical protein